jgi:hypothetical protein
MLLYRHLPPRYAANAIYKGEIRLGTLGIYNDGEKVGDARHDRMEGRLEYHIQKVLPTSTREHDFLNAVTGSTFIGCHFENRMPGRPAVIHEVVADDCYILCLSRENEKHQRRTFGGSGFIINDLGGFVRAITANLNASGLIKGEAEIADIAYKEKERDFTEFKASGPMIWKTKPAVFSIEAETRIKWTPAEHLPCPSPTRSEFVKPPSQLQPTVITCPEIIPFIGPLN